MLTSPNPTPYDLRFRLLDTPVRVSPWFWLGMLLIGPKAGSSRALIEPRETVIWTACVFVSILLHEFGHALMARAFGSRSRITLIALGGLCELDEPRQSWGRRVLISAAGPAIQLAFLVGIMAGGVGLLGMSWRGNLFLGEYFLGLGSPGRIWREDLGVLADVGNIKAQFYWYLFQINWLWPLLNLLPLWPLDGGQILHAALSRANPRHGARWTHIVSMACGGLLAFYALSRMDFSEGQGDYFRVLFFGFFAVVNYQMLQVHHRRYLDSGYDDDADWWKR